MPSLIPVLLNDHDLSPALRADLQAYQEARTPEARTVARRRAAMGLLSAFDLDAIEVASLLKLDGEAGPRPRPALRLTGSPATC